MWFRRKPEPDPMVEMLVDILREQSAQQQRLIEQVLEASREQAAMSQHMVEELVSLWKPSRQPQTTTEEERAKAREQAEQWEPLTEDIFKQLDADIGIPAEFLS